MWAGYVFTRRQERRRRAASGRRRTEGDHGDRVAADEREPLPALRARVDTTVTATTVASAIVTSSTGLKASVSPRPKRPESSAIAGATNTATWVEERDRDLGAEVAGCRGARSR